MRKQAAVEVKPVAKRLPAWLKCAGVPRSTYYTLPPDLRPDTTLLNGLVYVRESEEHWWERVDAYNKARAEPKRQRRRFKKSIESLTQTEPVAMAAAGQDNS